jgi:predicted unusual protein kinase regulating ubiquinone biosynthesis (AarF/ABC1/UbiB family)
MFWIYGIGLSSKIRKPKASIKKKKLESNICNPFLQQVTESLNLHNKNVDIEFNAHDVFLEYM